MATTAFPYLVDGMVQAFKASPALSGVMIFDGPEINEDYPGSWIAVGHDGSEDMDVNAGSAQNEYLQLGAKRMYEDGNVNCTLSAWTGDTDLPTVRRAAYSLLDAVDTAIRSDPSFNGVVLWSGLATHNPIYRQTNAGADMTINFTIAYRART